MKDRTKATLDRLRRDALPFAEAASIFGFQERLSESQWFARDRLEAYQLGHLKALARFAVQHVPAYRDRFSLAALEAATELRAGLSALPILPRQELATEPARLRSDALPPGHEPAGERQSSGSSGQIVRVAATNIAFAWQNALTLRAQLWAGRKFDLTMAVIRKNQPGFAEYPDGAVSDRWDEASVLPFRTGPACHLGTTSSVEQQWEWLERMRPAYLMAYPSIIRQFAARAALERKPPTRLLGISTVGETVDTDLRDAAKRHLGAEIFDVYSAEEVGAIALQCPTCRRYHVQSEAIILEILDAGGQPCRAGETGRVVLTPLFNFATPLLRYDIGDMAEAGAACACGRGLPVLNRILGRHRNLLTLPDGRHYWPSFGSRVWQKRVPVRQQQFRQVAADTIEAWLAVDRPVTQDEEAEMRRVIASRLPAPFQIRFHYVDAIEPGPGGKSEEFVSLV